MATDKKWYAVKVKFRCEKFVLNSLLKKNIECFLPLMTETKIYKSKKKVVQKPLINSYVFVRITEREVVKVLQGEYVFDFLKNNGARSIVREEEIDILKRVVGIHNDALRVNHDQYYTMGSEVEVISGSLTGLKGKVVEQKGKQYFVVEIDSLGVSISMKVNKKHLRVIGSITI